LSIQDPDWDPSGSFLTIITYLLGDLIKKIRLKNASTTTDKKVFFAWLIDEDEINVLIDHE